jgi:hypothetical protein
VTRKGARPDETKAKAVALLLEGLPKGEIAQQLGIDRVTLFRWETEDSEFQAIRRQVLDSIVSIAHNDFRELTTKAVKVLDEAMDAGVKITVPGPDGQDIELEAVDHKTRSQAAERVLKRVAEFAPTVEVELDASAQLTELIRRLDARRGSDGRGPGAPAGKPAAVRGGHPVDPDEAKAGKTV